MDQVGQNKAILRRFFDEVVARADTRPPVSCSRRRSSRRPSGPRRSRMRRFPDLAVSVDDMIAEGDRVVAMVTITGTHSGVLRLGSHPELTPTGRRATWTGVDDVRIAEGKIVDRRSPRDTLVCSVSRGSPRRRSGPRSGEDRGYRFRESQVAVDGTSGVIQQRRAKDSVTARSARLPQRGTTY